MNSAADTSATPVRLRDTILEDLPTLFVQQQDPDAYRMAAFPPRDWDAFLAHWTKILADAAVTKRTVLLDERVAGYVVAWERDGRRLVGYWIGKEYWGRGVATRALSRFLDAERARPVYAYVAKQNAASIRVLEKCGFTVCVEEAASLAVPADGVEEYLYQLGTNDGDGV
ncbi:MAG: GNAT family N-acetyltransferase [Candidatus Bipolaricaulis sp.]|nr:GNAT family N-acetyltransferase [Candidatus Bipolaricaulis sp.]